MHSTLSCGQQQEQLRCSRTVTNLSGDFWNTALEVFVAELVGATFKLDAMGALMVMDVV
jgi:hypothetical protein